MREARPLAGGHRCTPSGGPLSGVVCHGNAESKSLAEGYRNGPFLPYLGIGLNLQRERAEAGSRLKNRQLPAGSRKGVIQGQVEQVPHRRTYPESSNSVQSIGILHAAQHVPFLPSLQPLLQLIPFARLPKLLFRRPGYARDELEDIVTLALTEMCFGQGGREKRGEGFG